MDILKLISSEKERCHEMMTLLPYVYPLDENKALSQDEKSNLETMWYSFHEKAEHEAYFDFFDKSEFCRKYRKTVAKDEELFLTLISDRDFLFPVYSERFEDDRFSPLADKCKDDPGLLPLSEVVRAYDTYIKTGTPKEKLDYVLNHPFIPYPKHKEAYRTLQGNLKELKDAKALREKQMRELHPEFAPFSLTIPKEQPEESDLSERELLLCEIFKKYVLACVEYAYEARLDRSKMEEAPWRCAIHTVYGYLENRQETFGGEKAVVFFHLFSQYTQKLLLGSLRQYHFGPLKERVSKGETPAVAQRRTSGKIQCNIQLFDLLAEVWPIDEAQMQDLKYIFYVYSRYDRYWHYEVNRPRKGLVSFSGKENFKDGVDHFGNLLRYNINYCIPVSARWLLPIMTPNWREDPLATLSTFLLSESVLDIPMQDRIASRIKAYQKTDYWKKLLEEYRRIYTEPAEVKNLLGKWIKEHRLTIPQQEELLYEGRSGRTIAKYGGHYFLEFALRMELIKEAKENLGKAAKLYFDSLCLDGFSYSEHEPTKPLAKRREEEKNQQSGNGKGAQPKQKQQ